MSLVAVATAQSTSQASATPAFSPEDWQKYSGLFAQLNGVFRRARERVQFPAARNQSRLLPLLPQSTVFYAAFPNYGEATHQFLTTFQDELKENAELRNWWEHGEMGTQGPKIVDSLERLYQLSRYLGDEVIVSAADVGKKDPALLVLAEVHEPGLKEFLQQGLQQLAGKSKPAARVFDAAELANARELPGSNQFVVLVLPDLVAAASNVSTLRAFKAHLESRGQGLLSTGFGQRLTKSYEGGVVTLAGADVQAILRLMSHTEQGHELFQATGFSDMKYLVWEHKALGGESVSQVELSFAGPRRGIASWLAAPGPMRSLEFVSPNAVIAGTMLLKDPAMILDDIQDIAIAANPNARTSLAQTEQSLHVSLREDLFRRLGGEVTLELDSFKEPDPAWKVILKTSDPSRVLATLRTLLLASHIPMSETEEDGVTYHTIQLPSAQKAREISYAVMDGYLIVAPTRTGIADAVHAHRSGDSLVASTKFQNSLPHGDLAQTSAIFYEDAAAMGSLMLRRISPQLADSLSSPTAQSVAAIICGYADETTLREVSRSQGVDVAGTLIVAAIAIPNLLRARVAANESSAAAMVRTLNTAQISYATTYPKIGYASRLTALGLNAGVPSYSPQHAGLIDFAAGDGSCEGSWCSKSGYRFTVRANCRPQQPCNEFLVLATPISTSTGSRNFCSTSDAVVRTHVGRPLDQPITAAECKSWMPLQ
ncbi:MAG TPA: hypothetical protein VFO39_18545 [Candidatus Sulfotelmatobacter sp.]|nr:hypothetical protein [Candidatus Sulfotelmatobacter sp.]